MSPGFEPRMTHHFMQNITDCGTIVKSPTIRKSMEDELYPFTLSYTLPNGMEYSVLITNDGQSEDEYTRMFRVCGPDVKFSVD